MCVYINIHIIYIHIYVCVYIYMCVCIYTYVYIYIYTHTYIHIYMACVYAPFLSPCSNSTPLPSSHLVGCAKLLYARRDLTHGDSPHAMYNANTPLPLHNITNIVWCDAYKGEVEEGSYIAQESRNSIATVWPMQVDWRNERTIDSCTNDSK